MGMFFGAVTFGIALGPLGVITSIWRCGIYPHIALAVMVVYVLALMHVRYNKKSALEVKVKSIDSAARIIVTIPVLFKLDSLTRKTGATPRK